MYEVTLRKFATTVGDLPILNISAKDVDAFKVARLKSISPTSVNIDLRTLRAAFYTAMRWKIISENPTKGVSMARVPDTQPCYLTGEEFQKLLSIVKDEWFKDLLILAVTTGMRRGELLNLRWSDINLSERLIRIQSNGTFRTKAGKMGWIPINESAYLVLAKRGKESMTGAVFQFKGQMVSPSFVTHKFSRAVRSAKFNGKTHFHSLRHTFASWLVQSGSSIYEIQKLLGHSNIKITQIYSHLVSAQLQECVEKISVWVPVEN